jgi:signal transduction histidine kinase
VGSDGPDDTPSRLAALGEIAAEVAHELHNLLQVIASSAYVARVEIGRGDAAAAKDQVVKVERHVRLAHALVDDVMSLARGETLQKESTPVVDVLHAARADFAHGAARWDDAIEPTGAGVLAHPRLLARLLHALYENAILASAPRPPAIATRVRAEADRVVFEVGDDGPGIPQAIAARVFEPLVTARSGGTGLGLALARRIAAAHGGTLGLPDTGSANAATVPATFRLVLPA